MGDYDNLQGDPPKHSTESSKPSQRRVFRRTARACDECRARKIRCSGLQPCEPCHEFSRRCIYSLNPRRSTDPRQKSRLLELQLGRFRKLLSKIQMENRPMSHEEACAALETLDNSLVGESHDESDEHADGTKLDSMMGSHGRVALDNPWASRFYGAPSGLAFLQRTEEFFSPQQSELTDDLDSTKSVISQLFDAPLPNTLPEDGDNITAAQLPHRETVSAMLITIFKSTYPVFPILHEPTFYHSVDQLYSKNPIEYDESDRAFLPLFHIVLALGYLFNQNSHQNYGCRKAVTESFKHYHTAKRLLDICDCRGIRSLQVLLCITLFLISIARLASAHAYLALACSSTLRLGLHYRSTSDTTISKDDQDTRRRLFWTVIKLDMYLSAVLGLPTFIDLSQVDHVIDLTLEEAIQESTLGFPGREAISLAISAKHLEVMRIVTKAIRTLYPMPTSQDGISKPAGNISISLPRLRQVEDEFAAWSKSASDLLKRAHSDESEFCSLRYELEMAFYFARIVLYRPFLHYLARMSDGGSVTQEQSRRALVCIRYASMAIEQSQAMWDRDLLHPASWTSIYTIFLSVVCLIFLIATQKGTKNPIEAWRNADRGIRLLASTSCLEQGSIQCLGVLKQLVRRLSHTVEFDIASIELESPRACGNDAIIDTFSSNQTGDPSAAQSHGTKDEEFAVSQNSSGLYGAQQPWQITGSQLHMQEWPHLDYSDIDEGFSWPNFLYQDSDPFNFGSLSGDLFLQQPSLTLENEVVDVPALQRFSWPSDGFADMLNLPHS